MSLCIVPMMARKPTKAAHVNLDVGDEIFVRGEVTRMAENALGGWDVTVQVEGFGQSRITLAAEHVHKVEE